MKPPYTTPIQPITHNCSFMPQGSNVIFIAKSNKLAVSTIAFASALNMHGIPYICASYPGKCEQLNLALGAENVIKLPVWSINPQSRYLGKLIQRAREESAILIIDAEVIPSFEFGQLPDAMNLLRGDTLSIVLSMIGGRKKVPGMNTVWSCKPDRCVVHALGCDPSGPTGEGFEPHVELMPTWYSGEITNEMLNVLARSGPYQNLPAIPDLLGMFMSMPDDSPIREDRNIKAVVEMLARVREDAWETIFDAFVHELT